MSCAKFDDSPRNEPTFVTTVLSAVVSAAASFDPGTNRFADVKSACETLALEESMLTGVVFERDVPSTGLAKPSVTWISRSNLPLIVAPPSGTVGSVPEIEMPSAVNLKPSWFGPTSAAATSPFAGSAQLQSGIGRGV